MAGNVFLMLHVPDAAWIELDRWNTLKCSEKEKFPPICPDFVSKLRSKTAQFQPLQEKIKEYLNSGLHLGWLINPQDEGGEIYRQNQSVEVVKFPVNLNGEDILSDLILPLPFDE